MKSIIIAAGLGIRLNGLTADKPKCLLDINGKSLLQWQLDAFKQNGVTNIAIVRGYQHEKINIPGARYYYNDNYRNNNILNSLMYAEPEMDEEFIAAYSDIIFQPSVVKTLLDSTADVTIVVDLDWKWYYEGRTEHPLSEAEKVIVDEKDQVIHVGKDIDMMVQPGQKGGEFIGMLKCSKEGAKIFKEFFHKAKQEYQGKKFMRAAIFEKAYITDFIQYLTNNGIKVKCVFINQGWFEIDTQQDLGKVREFYNKLERVESNG